MTQLAENLRTAPSREGHGRDARLSSNAKVAGKWPGTPFGPSSRWLRATLRRSRTLDPSDLPLETRGLCDGLPG